MRNKFRQRCIRSRLSWAETGVSFEVGLYLVVGELLPVSDPPGLCEFLQTDVRINLPARGGWPRWACCSKTDHLALANSSGANPGMLGRYAEIRNQR